MNFCHATAQTIHHVRCTLKHRIRFLEFRIIQKEKFRLAHDEVLQLSIRTREPFFHLMIHTLPNRDTNSSCTRWSYRNVTLQIHNAKLFLQLSVMIRQLDSLENLKFCGLAFRGILRTTDHKSFREAFGRILAKSRERPRKISAT